MVFKYLARYIPTLFFTEPKSQEHERIVQNWFRYFHRQLSISKSISDRFSFVFTNALTVLSCNMALKQSEVRKLVSSVHSASKSFYSDCRLDIKHCMMIKED